MPRPVVMATGDKRQEELVRKLFGETFESASARYGMRRGAGTRNMYTRTGQPGL